VPDNKLDRKFWAKLALLCFGIGAGLYLLVSFQNSGSAVGEATGGLVAALVPVALLIAVGAALVWVIRKGVSQGLDDHEKRKR
jgi:hypothetical protein